MNRPGTYILEISLSAPADLEVGALGMIHFDPGTYVYVGSAMGGLDQRISRHCSRDKTLRWHIDYLTVAADQVIGHESFPDPIPECTLARMAEDIGMEPAVPGFGCSDCGCRTHLFKATREQVRDMVRDAGLVRADNLIKSHSTFSRSPHIIK